MCPQRCAFNSARCRFPFCLLDAVLVFRAHTNAKLIQFLAFITPELSLDCHSEASYKVCVDVYAYIVYVCVYMCMYMYLYVNAHGYLYVYVCCRFFVLCRCDIRSFVHVWVYAYVYIHASTCVYMCCVFVYVRVLRVCRHRSMHVRLWDAISSVYVWR